MHHAAGWDASILATARSEYNGSYGSKGVRAISMKLAEVLIGPDARDARAKYSPVLDGIGR
jgi:hypothetical protein